MCGTPRKPSTTNQAAAPLIEDADTNAAEVKVLRSLLDALFATDASLVDEIEPLVLRFRAAAKAHAQAGNLINFEFDGFYFSARLHEVFCTCTPGVGNALGTP